MEPFHQPPHKTVRSVHLLQPGIMADQQQQEPAQAGQHVEEAADMDQQQQQEQQEQHQEDAPKLSKRQQKRMLKMER